jgi:hypothetical protein
MTGFKSKKATAQDKLAQLEQEPVAYWNFNSGFSHCMIDQLNEAAKKNPAPLYTTPPQRTWVGLTEEETSGFTQHEMAVVKYVSKVLQEKNT